MTSELQAWGNIGFVTLMSDSESSLSSGFNRYPARSLVSMNVSLPRGTPRLTFKGSIAFRSRLEHVAVGVIQDSQFESFVIR